MPSIDKTIRWEGLEANFTMEVSVGDSPNTTTTYVIEVTMDCDVDFKKYRDYLVGGQSARVAMQATMRTLDKSTLERLEQEGLRIRVSDIKNRDAYLTDEDKLNTLAEFLKGLDPELRKAALAKLND